jgi:HEAT repeat protein
VWDEFQLTSLGKNWRQVVKGWKEEQRADFIGEVVSERSMSDVAEEFALTDSSPRVRAAVIHALEWIDASEALSRVLTAFDDETFEDLLRDHVIDTIPIGMKPRALLTYEKFLQKADDSRERLRIRLAQASLGAQHNLEGLKEDLTKWPSEKVADTDHWLLNSALEVTRKTDPRGSAIGPRVALLMVCCGLTVG